MARFTLTGLRSGAEQVSLTWEDGELSGDADACEMVRLLAEGYEGRTIGQAGGPYTTHDHLTSPYTARDLMQQVFSARPTLTDGALPPLPPVPDGAIR